MRRDNAEGKITYRAKILRYAQDGQRTPGLPPSHTLKGLRTGTAK